MSRRESGCSGCGDLGHNVASRLTEGAAAHYERTGQHRKAAVVRRQIAALGEARRATTISAAGVRALARSIR